MNKKDLTKIVVNNLTGFAVGSATRGVIGNSIPRTNNIVLNIAIDASVIVGTWAVSGTVMKPVVEHSDEKVDELFDTFSTFKNKI